LTRRDENHAATHRRDYDFRTNKQLNLNMNSVFYIIGVIVVVVVILKLVGLW